MPVDPHSHVPIYEQIVEHICGAVAAGVYRPEEMLPSIRALSLDLVVNPNTVQRAYQELERQGLVYMRKGLGVLVAKDGHACALRGAEAAVRARLVQAIELARAANLSPEQFEALFREAMTHAVPASGTTGALKTEGASGGRADS